MKQTAAILVAVFSYLAVSGQQKLFLVKHTGDTLFCNSIKLDKKKFIVNDNRGGFIIPADSIKLIRYKERERLVVHCLLHQYTDDLYTMERGWVRLASADTVLYLEEIYTSPKMNLYQAKDNFKVNYFFYKTPSDHLPVQLVVRYHIEGGALSSYSNSTPANNSDLSRAHIEEDKGYVNQLKTIMKNCAHIPEAVWEILVYREFSIKQVIKRYNQCK